MRKEITLLGALHIALSIIYIVVSLGIIAVLYSEGFFHGAAASIGEVISAVAGGFLVIVALMGIAGGTGVIHGANWAHMVVLILGCLDLVCLPLGTILGIYTVYIFMKENTPEKRGPPELKVACGQQDSPSSFTNYSLHKESAATG